MQHHDRWAHHQDRHRPTSPNALFRVDDGLQLDRSHHGGFILSSRPREILGRVINREGLRLSVNGLQREFEHLLALRAPRRRQRAIEDPDGFEYYTPDEVPGGWRQKDLIVGKSRDCDQFLTGMAQMAAESG